MNRLNLEIKTLQNKYYEYFVKSPRLFLNRVDFAIQRRFGIQLGLSTKQTADAILWVRESTKFHSRVYLFNYWTEHYGIKEQIQVEATLFDSSGIKLGSQSIYLEPRQTRMIEARSFAGFPKDSPEFVGYVYFQRINGGPGSNVPLKLFQEYYQGSCIGCIHEYSTADNYSYLENQTGVSLIGKGVSDVSIGLVNCFISGEGKKNKITLTVLNRAGEKLKSGGLSFPGGYAGHFRLSEHLPKWKEFLGEDAGNLLVQSNHSIGRPLIFHHYESEKSFALNHATSEKSRQYHIYRPPFPSLLGSGPIWTAAAAFSSKMTTTATILNMFGFNQPYEIVWEIYDQSGTLIANSTETLKPWETRRIDFRPYLKGHLTDELTTGSVRMWVKPNSKIGYLVPSFDANIEFEGEGWRAPVNIGASLLNMAVPEGIKSPHKRRTKIFMRVLHSLSRETWVLLTNHSSDPTYNTESQTKVRLISGDGKTELVKDLTIPPRGAVFTPVASLFPQIEEYLGVEGVGQLHIVDSKAKLNGIHLVHNKQSGSFAGDHCIGG